MSIALGQAYDPGVRYAAVVAIAALLVLDGCASGHRAIDRKAYAKVFIIRKTHKTIFRR